MLVEPSDFEKRKWMDGKEFHLVTNQKELDDMVAECIDSPRVGFDTETTGLNILKDRIAGYCLSPSFKRGYYVPIRHERGVNIDLDLANEAIQTILNESPMIDMHHAEFDIGMVWNEGIKFHDFRRLRDSMLMYWMQDVGAKRPLKLKAIAKSMLGIEMLELWHCFGHKEKPKNFTPTVHHLDPLKVTVYGASDGMATTELCKRLEDDEWVKKQATILQVEMATAICLTWMDRHPMMLDLEYAEGWKHKLESKQKEVESQIYEVVGRSFNIASTDQLADVLYNQLGLPVIAVTSEKSNKPSTDEETLLSLKKKTSHPVLDLIIEYRGYGKQLSTYLEPFLKDNENGWTCIGHYQPATDTGRIQGRKGEFQKDGKLGMSISTVPSNKDAKTGFYDPRRVFVARPLYVIVAIDFSNEEMRIAANLSDEDEWINALNNGADMHSTMAALMYKKTIDKVTKPERSNAKGLNFRYLYGGGGPWEEDYVTYYAAVPKLKAWQDKMKAFMRNNGYVYTAWGRIRRAEQFVKSADKKKRAFADRVAVNTPVQGSGSDILRLSLIQFILGKVFKQHPELNGYVFVRILIHDEIVFEFPTDEFIQQTPELRDKGWTFEKLLVMACEVMESVRVPTWRCPLKVEGHYGKSWSPVGGTEFHLDQETGRIVYGKYSPTEADLAKRVSTIEYCTRDSKLFLRIPAELRNNSFLNKMRSALEQSMAESGVPVVIAFADSDKNHESPGLYDPQKLLSAISSFIGISEVMLTS